MRSPRYILRHRRGSETLENGLMLGLMVAGALFVILWVGEKVHDKLADFDSATHVVAHETDYKKVKVKDPPPGKSQPVSSRQAK